MENSLEGFEDKFTEISQKVGQKRQQKCVWGGEEKGRMTKDKTRKIEGMKSSLIQDNFTE